MPRTVKAVKMAHNEEEVDYGDDRAMEADQDKSAEAGGKEGPGMEVAAQDVVMAATPPPRLLPRYWTSPP